MLKCRLIQQDWAGACLGFCIYNKPSTDADGLGTSLLSSKALEEPLVFNLARLFELFSRS